MTENAENTARKLQNVTGSSSLDAVPEQRRPALPVARTGNETVDRQIDRNREMPTHHLRQMAATAREHIDECEMKREGMVAWGETQLRDAQAAYDDKAKTNQNAIEHHTAEITRLRGLMEADATAHKTSTENINTRLAQEIGAIDAMVAAQQGVIETLAKNVTPAKGKAKA